jgi:hypothetical protein
VTSVTTAVGESVTDASGGMVWFPAAEEVGMERTSGEPIGGIVIEAVDAGSVLDAMGSVAVASVSEEMVVRAFGATR